MPIKKRGRASSKYRKPPVEHQFKKGTSGNPKGRPKKKAVLGGFTTLGGGVVDRLGAMVLDEATRMVTVREGDKVSEMPAMQALFRTMLRAAAQGDTKAGRQILDVITRAESARAGIALEMLQNAGQYQEKHALTFEKHEREGLDPPDIYPHPYDFIIDEKTGEVTIDGPMTKEQAGARKAFREEALKSFPRYLEAEEALRKEPTNHALKREFKELKKYFDFLKKDAERNVRHETLRQSRRAAEQPSPKVSNDTTDQS